MADQVLLDAETMRCGFVVVALFGMLFFSSVLFT